MRTQKPSRKETILLVDDDVYAMGYVVTALRSYGYEVFFAKTVREAKDILLKHSVDLAIVDIMLPLGENLPSDAEEVIAAHGGYRAGQVLARWILEQKPEVEFFGISSVVDSEVCEWFNEHGSGILPKPFPCSDVIEMIEKALHGGAAVRKGPVTFIIHGHDEVAKLELKNYLQK